MKQFFACFANEWTKLICKKKYWVLLILGVYVGLGVTLCKILLGKITHGSVNFSFLSSAMSLAGLFLNFWIPLVSVMAVCDLFATEYQDLTIKATLLRPIHRFKVYTAKIAAVAALALLYMLVLPITAGMMDIICGGTGNNFFYAVSAYLIDWIPMIVVILMAVFINQLQKGSTMTMFLCIILYILLYVGGILVPNLSGLLFTGYLSWHSLWLGHLLPFGAMLSKVGLLVGYGMVFFCGGYLIFLHREV